MKILIADTKKEKESLYGTLSGKFPEVEMVICRPKDIRKADEGFDAILINLSQFVFGPTAIKDLKKSNSTAKIHFFIYGSRDNQDDNDAIKAGAEGCFYLPEEILRVEGLVSKLIADDDKSFLEKNIVVSEDNCGIIGDTQAIKSINDFIMKSATSSLPLLIEGESGTGKELVANAIHKSSPRAKKIFIAINCGALPKDLLENELFGHEAGAFTGATTIKRGLFEVADGGTLFIDEIGEMDPAAQVKLLRVLENGNFRRLGGTKQINTNVRVLAATNRVLETEIENKKFRTDLYYRLNALRVFLPPLRERRNDIPVLVRHFLSRSAAGKRKNMSKETMELLFNYKWPGNIRELSNVIERVLVVSGTREEITPKDLPDYLITYNPQAGKTDIQHELEEPLSEFLERMEKQYLTALLHSHGDNKVKLAKILKISRAKLYRKLDKYHIG